MELLSNDSLVELENEEDDPNGEMDSNLILHEENEMPIMKQSEFSVLPSSVIPSAQDVPSIKS